MSSNSNAIALFKAQLSKFSGNFEKHLNSSKNRLVKEMIYGIQAAKDVKLSNIARTLKEDQPLIKTEDRLSRNLDDVDLTEIINNEICRLASNKINENSIIAIDPGDIAKKYAKKMEFLYKVHDGSEGEIVNGYPVCAAVATDLETKSLIPLYLEAYSTIADGFESENKQIFKAIEMITKNVGNKGVYVIDRGGDRPAIFNQMFKNNLKFVIRLKDRNLMHNGIPINSAEIAKCIDTPYKSALIFYKNSMETRCEVSYNATKVKLPFATENPLYLVVVKGFGLQPMKLLTNCELDLKAKEIIWRIVEYYLARWKCEESYRYIKQSYNLEDLRVRSYKSIRNIVALVLAVSYFAISYLGDNIKLKFFIEKIYIISKRFFGVPTFSGYAIVDGIFNLLFPDKNALKHLNVKQIEDFQLNFNLT